MLCPRVEAGDSGGWWVSSWSGIGVCPLNVLQHTDKFLAVTGIMTNTWIFILLADYFV